MDDDLDSAFVNEIARSQPMMRAYLAKLLANSSSTDDVLQEANKVVWTKREAWDPETPFLKWAYRICYFQAKAYLRDLGREKLVFKGELIDILADESPREISSGQREEALGECLEKLDSRKRNLVLRRYHPNETLKSMAKELGLPANSLSQQLRRLRLQLHDCIQKNLASRSL